MSTELSLNSPICIEFPQMSFEVTLHNNFFGRSRCFRLGMPVRDATTCTESGRTRSISSYVAVVLHAEIVRHRGHLPHRQVNGININRGLSIIAILSFRAFECS
jgi:hypothetical protein